MNKAIDQGNLELIAASSEWLAEVFGVTSRTIWNWAEQGDFQVGKNQFDVAGCIDWALHKNDLRRAKLEAEIKDIEYRAELKRIDIEERLGRLIPVEDANDYLLTLATLVKGRLEAIPSQLAIALAGATSPEEIEEILSLRVADVLSELQTELMELDPDGEEDD